MANNFNPHASYDAIWDADQDGLTNLQEYWSGTNSRNNRSFLQLQSKITPPNTALLQFEAAATKSYSLEGTTPLLSGVWLNSATATSITGYSIDLPELTAHISAHWYK